MNLLMVVIFSALMQTATPGTAPMHQEHTRDSSQHQSDVEKHGDQAMGFPHDKTTHHFRLYSDGGAIDVTANDSADAANVQAIRSHLEHIAGMFSEGKCCRFLCSFTIRFLPASPA